VHYGLTGVCDWIFIELINFETIDERDVYAVEYIHDCIVEYSSKTGLTALPDRRVHRIINWKEAAMFVVFHKFCN
jgi:hypothetical protein